MNVSPQLERHLKTTQGLDRVRRVSLVRRWVTQALKGATDLDLRRNAPRTVNALDESGTAFTATNAVAEFKRQAALTAKADAKFKERAPKTIEVRRHIKKILRGFPQITRETIAALIAYDLEQRGADVTRETVAELVEEMRKTRAKLFSVSSLYEPINSEGF